ncbi:MAG: TonB-dependent receptor [Rhizomicrobium sp.]
MGVNRFSHSLLFAASAVALIAGAPARAQDAAAPPRDAGPSQGAATVETVVVTAERRSQDVQTVPIAITAASAERLQAVGITNTQQLSLIAPSLNVSNIAGGVSFFIRGVGTTASQVENQVVTYLDDVYVPDQRHVGLDLIDVDQVAVLKGPQGTLFGRNATGGVIQVSTRDPGDTPEMEVRTSLDNYFTSRSGIFVGGPITDSIRGSFTGGFTTQGNGWGHNPIANYDTFKISDDLNLRGKLIFDFGNDASLKLIADYKNMDDTAAIIEVPYPGTVLAFEPGVVGPDNYYNSRGNYPNVQHMTDGGLSADLRFKVGDLSVRSITGYRAGIDNFQFDADRTPVPAFDINVKERDHNFSQEVQVLSPEDGPFKWVLGAYYFHNYNGALPFTLHFQGPFAPGPTDLGHEFISAVETTNSFAGFGQATWEILPGTHLTGGLRYTTEKRQLFGSDTGTLNDGTPETFSTANGTGPHTITFGNWSFRGALDHQFTDDIMGYISFDRGFKSGGYNISSLTNPAFKPEQLDAYQAGLKTELFDHRLRLNAAAFYYDYRNVQVVTFTFVSQITNGAAAEMYGIDADFEAQIDDHLSLTGGLSLLHSVFTNYKNAVFTVPLGGGAYSLISGDATGNRTPFSEPVQASLGVDYTVDTDMGGLLFNVTDSYNSDYYYEADNNMRQPAYNMLNASATLTLPGDKYSVKLWGTNLLDKRVGTYAASQALGLLVSYGTAPRLFGITLDAKL